MNPYKNFPPERFWKTGAEKSHPLTVEGIYRKKFPIAQSDKIATGGSCFAQHIAYNLRKCGYSVLDAEPAPKSVKDETAKKYGYRLYSARYGNIYVVRQLLQLLKEAFSGEVDERGLVWEKDGRYYDALRPTVEPFGLRSPEEVVLHRKNHLEKVARLFAEASIFVFTFGLTESWVNSHTGRVYPMCPGTVVGKFDPEKYEFKNFSFNEIRQDFLEFRKLVKKINPKIKFILTVSPVPLTATASEDHVIAATTYSKSVLRAVAGELCQEFSDFDYFPAYEMIASHWSKGFFYEQNLRSVNADGVQSVMRVFFNQHLIFKKETNKKANTTIKDLKNKKSEEDVICDEELLEAFSR